MVTLGINEFIRNIRRNILVIAQMIAIYMVAIFVISAFEEQYSLYAGVSNVLDDTGAVMITSRPMDETDNIVTYDGLKNLLNKVENIAVSYHDNSYIDGYEYRGKKGILEMQYVANNPELITYRPKLIEGDWCEDVPHKDGVIRVTISDNSEFDFKVGDTVHIKDERQDLMLYITGIFDSEELVYGYFSASRGAETNYLDFYDYVEKDLPLNMKSPVLAMAAYEDLSYGAIENKIIIDFEDDITTEEYNENMTRIKEYYGHVENCDIYNSKIIYDNSMAHLEIKLLPMFVLLAVVLFVLIVSMLTASAVNILYEKKNYGIYFICGNDWKKTFVISAIHWFTVSIASIAVAISGCLLMKASGKFPQLTLSFTTTHVWAILAIMAVTLIVALILPYNMLRKIQPVSILKENDD